MQDTGACFSKDKHNNKDKTMLFDNLYKIKDVYDFKFLDDDNLLFILRHFGVNKNPTMELLKLNLITKKIDKMMDEYVKDYGVFNSKILISGKDGTYLLDSSSNEKKKIEFNGEMNSLELLSINESARLRDSAGIAIL